MSAKNLVVVTTYFAIITVVKHRLTNIKMNVARSGVATGVLENSSDVSGIQTMSQVLMGCPDCRTDSKYDVEERPIINWRIEMTCKEIQTEGSIAGRQT